MVRVLIADDHPVAHRFLRWLLEPHFEIVGAVLDGQALVEAATKLRPDVIVTDLSMPVLNGLQAAEQLKRSGCTSAIIFLTVHADPDSIRACFAAGGVAHVAKANMDSDLLPAIHTALACAHLT